CFPPDREYSLCGLLRPWCLRPRWRHHRHAAHSRLISSLEYPSGASMPYRFRVSLLLALLLTVYATSAATPHPGGLDAYRCHHDHQRGGYHCHQGPFAGQSFASQAEMQTARQQNSAAFPPTLPVNRFSGTVVSVLDGDTIEVLYNRRAKRIRLNGIDAPEK